MDAEEPQRRPSRKSVAFQEEKLVVDADGKVTVVASSDDETKNTAMSHTPSTPPLEAALEASKAEAAAAKTENPAVDEEIGDLLPLKKKKKAKKPVEDGEADDDDAAGADGDEPVLDLGMKKKKKKPKKPEAEDDFEAKLEALDIDKEGGEEEQAEQAGDMDEGTGIWQHDESKPIVYDLLLQRFFNLLSHKNPDHAAGGSRSYKIPPPQCMREGNKKTIFVNLPEICKRMNRSEEHVTAFLFTELGTSGSVAEGRKLVIKGRFQSKQLENVLRKYIIDYVTCKTCRSPDTNLSKGENRLYFITCNSCQSRRSVQAIKTGFSAQVGKRKKMRV